MKRTINNLLRFLSLMGSLIFLSSAQSPTVEPAATADDCNTKTQFFCAFQCMNFTEFPNATPEACKQSIGGQTVCRKGKTMWDGKSTNGTYTLGCAVITNDPAKYVNYSQAGVPAIGTPKPTMAPTTGTNSNGMNADGTTGNGSSSSLKQNLAGTFLMMAFGALL